MVPYKHQRLTSPSSQIRLLELLPGRGTIRCRLRVADLETVKGTYEPISYCWRTPQNKIHHHHHHHHMHPTGSLMMGVATRQGFRIQVDGTGVTISENLHAALLRIRRSRQGPGTGSGEEGEARVLWADALCINQADTAEKSIQVAMMRDIYQGGRRTLSWLGGSSFWSEIAFGTIERRKWHPRGDCGKAQQLEGNPCTTSAWAWGEASNSLRRLRGRLWDYIFGVSLTWTFKRPYFERVWVIQEVAKSPRVTVLCGRHEVDWDALASEIRSTGSHPGPGTLPFLTIDDMRRRRLSGTWGLPEVMKRLRHTQATDARDKLYSVLGLVTDSQKTIPVHVDYSRDVDDIFLEFSRNVILTTGKLDGLSMGYGSSPEDRKDVPSWVWNPQPTWRHGVLSSKNSKSSYPFKASGDSVCHPEFKDRRLGLRGYIVGQVSVTGCICPSLSHFLQMGRILKMFMCYLEWRDLAGLSSTKTDAVEMQRLREVFRHTIHPLGLASVPTRMPGSNDAIPMSDRNRFEIFDNEMMRRFGRHLSHGRKDGQTSSWEKFRLRISTLRLLCEGWICKPVALEARHFFISDIHVHDRRMVKTLEGSIVLCPKDTQKDDRIVLLQGASVPFVVRQVGDHWRLVGECYVHEFMFGNAWDTSQCETIWLE